MGHNTASVQPPAQDQRAKASSLGGLHTAEGLARINMRRARPIGSAKPPAPIKAAPHLARRQSDRNAWAKTHFDPNQAIHYEAQPPRGGRSVAGVLILIGLIDLAIVGLVAFGLSQLTRGM